jgi:beta-lactamase class D
MSDRHPCASVLIATLLLAAVVPTRAETLCTLLADGGTGAILSEVGTCSERVSPASTFKIALSLMGYDAGYLTDEHLPRLPFHAGYVDWVDSWKADTDPRRWIEESVVWYSQRLTEWLGEMRLRNYVHAFDYGNQDLTGDPGLQNGLTNAWLSSSLKISPLEQVRFLGKLVTRRLPVSAHAFDMTGRITRFATLADGWDVHGKTGTGSPARADGSLDEDREFGWFVGWAVQGTRTVVFAHLITERRSTATRLGLRARAEFMAALPAMLAGRR